MPEIQGLEPNPPVAPEWVELAYPGIDQPYRCAPSAVKHWEARGWSVVGTAEAPVNAAQVVVEKPAPKPTADPAGDPNPAPRR